MNATTNNNNAAERALLRKSLMQVASVMLLTLLSVTLLALFSVWSLQQAYQRNTREVAEVVSALDTSRQAQVHFKRQVQEWKNILLRGDFPVARARYFNAFESAEVDVGAALIKVDEILIAAGERRYHDRLMQMQQDHLVLGEKYRSALLDVSGGLWAPFESDLAVRGIDRPLNKAIDDLAAELLSESQTRSKALDEANALRYQALRYALWATMLVSLLLVGGMLWRVMVQSKATA